MANASAAVHEPLSGSEYQQKKLRQALLMKRLTNYIPIIGTVVLAEGFCQHDFDTSAIDVAVKEHFRENQWPKDLQAAYELGKRMVE